jgi:surface antigen
MTFRSFLAVILVLQLGGCAAILGNRAALYERLSDRDVTLAAKTLQQSLENAPDSETRRWANESTGHGGSVTPIRTYLSESGRFCRDYREDLASDDQTASFYHTACRDEEAGWIWL